MYQVNKEKFLSPEDMDSLRRYLHNNTSRDAIMLELCLATGARSREILNLKLSDFNLGEGTVLIHGVKGSLDREIPLHEDFIKKLKAFLGRTKLKSQDRVFAINSRRFRQIWNKLMPHLKGTDGKQGRGLHSLRHTFALELYKKHRDIMLVKTALGHCNIDNTLVYSNYVYKTEELRKLLTK